MRPYRIHLRYLDHHELSDPVAPSDPDRLMRIQVHDRAEHLTPIPGVDQSGRVRERQAVTRGEAGSGKDEAGAPLRDGHGEPGGDLGPFPGSDDDVSRRPKIQARVARMGSFGQRRCGIEAPEG